MLVLEVSDKQIKSIIKISENTNTFWKQGLNLSMGTNVGQNNVKSIKVNFSNLQ